MKSVLFTSGGNNWNPLFQRTTPAPSFLDITWVGSSLGERSNLHIGVSPFKVKLILWNYQMLLRIEVCVHFGDRATFSMKLRSLDVRRRMGSSSIWFTIRYYNRLGRSISSSSLCVNSYLIFSAFFANLITTSVLYLQFFELWVFLGLSGFVINLQLHLQPNMCWEYCEWVICVEGKMTECMREYTREKRPGLF